jgi:GTP-binding protein
LGSASFRATAGSSSPTSLGLIEGASEGAGLGHDFLRHIERTKAIVHLVDLAPLDGSKPAENYRTIRGELHAFSPTLAEKPEIVVFSKATARCRR